MPTRTLYRFWCKTCQEYTLHDDVCETCGTEATPYKLRDVPVEKIIEQRKRYRESRKKDILGIYMLLGVGAFVEPSLNIIECDAGQKSLDLHNKKIRDKEREARRLLEELYQTKYAGVGRNEPCPCGSGLKYKKCCLSKFVP